MNNKNNNRGFVIVSTLVCSAVLFVLLGTIAQMCHHWRMANRRFAEQTRLEAASIVVKP